MVEKTLILLRHAHRDNTQRELDNGLSEKGTKQVKRLAKYFRRRMEFEPWSPMQIQFMTSPKVRCLETLTPIAEIYRATPQVLPLLDEQQKGESHGQFQARVEGFCQSWIGSPAQITIICGHGDQLPLIAYHLLGAAIQLKKAGLVEIGYESGQAYLKQYLASLKIFFP